MLGNGRTLENLPPMVRTSEAESSNSGSGALEGRVRASDGAGKFDKAMKVYRKSMAIRRRLTSMARSTTCFVGNRNDGSGGTGAFDDENTAAQTPLNPLRGPMLRSSARITCLAPASPIASLASPQHSRVLPEVAFDVATASETTAMAASMLRSHVPLSALNSVRRLPSPPDIERQTAPSSSSPFSRAIPSRGRTKRGSCDRHLKVDAGSGENDAVWRKGSPTCSAHLDFPSLFSAGRQCTASRHSSGGTSEWVGVGIHKYAGQPSTSTVDSPLLSPMPSFHQMMGRSYDVPALDTIFRGFNNGVDQRQQGRILLRSPPSPTHATMPAAAPMSAPSVSTSLQLSSSLVSNTSVPSPAAAGTRQMPTASVLSSAATTAAADVHAMPAGSDGFPYLAPRLSAQAAARKDRSNSYPADKAHPDASRRSTAFRRAGVHASGSLALVKPMSSTPDLKPNKASVPPLGPPPLDASSTATTTTAQFYSTASLAKTFDGSQYLNDYILLNEIGSGSTGRVVLAFSTSMNKSVAIKIILKPKEKYRLQHRVSASPSASVFGQHSGRGDFGGVRAAAARSTTTPETMQNFKSSSSSAGRQSKHRKTPSTPPTTVADKTRNLQREIEVMRNLSHPNIVRLYEVINDPKANSLFLILQYVDNGAVAQLDSTGHIRAPLQPWTVLPIATQVSDGLAYLHEQSIVHRDIKPENILVNRDGHAFLADFGVAELMNAKAGQPTAATLTYQGTPLFMAPEIYAGVDGDDAEQASGGCTRWRGRDDADESSSMTATPSREERRDSRVIDPFALDVWALGVTFYTLLIGHVPFTSMLQISQTPEKGVSIPTPLPEQWRTVLRRTMEPRQELRISSAELCHMLHAMLADQEAAEVRAGGRSRKASLSTRSRIATLGNRRTTSHQSCTGSRTARSASLPADMEEESVNLSSSSSSGSSTGRSSTSPSYSSGGSSSGDESGTSGNDQGVLGLSITSVVLNILRPTRIRKNRS
ncbi:putative protein kinase, putative,serine/threonine protein kinase [Leishmania mexicana MHOM/GT/2001/U1103]|uniref:Protein kinase domain-containing protein n=1 Tax=Leishmania mexicana (strain MHOM/GT/2001/U1103) TaxID=929439 RepID=E9ANH1_LEIMU|nr:putative protein kinase, putative,serine/threonine protein kinase [Leishmania mexicana MHOM/GT/2001/U1103]CBZ24480.1 putative protein kinase, putative,serine/threonine protein kinase [Leishmania mexicana MHOM/GT/2001/U1103]